MISRSETLVTVFGGSGFIGRYVCEYLLKSGVRLRVASRDPRNAYFLQPLAQVGQWGRVHANITDRHSVAAAVKGANAVINLTGSFRKMHAVHVEGPGIVAEEARRPARRRWSMSARSAPTRRRNPITAGPRAQGEAAVRKAFPEATIIRPSLVFGAEDQLTNRFAGMAPLPDRPGARAPGPNSSRSLSATSRKAIAAAALDPAAHGGKIYEIAGPEVVSMLGLHRAIYAVTGQDPELVALPNIAGSALSALGFLPGAPLTRDQWLMLQRDNVAARGAPGLKAFGIEPTPLGAVAGEWLGRFRGAKAAQRQPPGRAAA